MATEQEELRLTVSLVDNASAGLAALRGQIQGLSSGASKQSMDSFQRNQKEMGEQIKQITAAAIGGERAMLGFISRFGALGLAASAGISAMKGFSQGLADINRMSQALGVPATQIKNVVDQLKAGGASTEEAKAEVQGFVQALVDIGRVGSPQFEALLNRSGAYANQMSDLLRKTESMTQLEDKLNAIRQAGEEVRQNRERQDLAKGQSPAQAAEDAAQAEREFLNLLGLHADLQDRIIGQFKPMTDAERAHAAAVLKVSKDITDAYTQIGRAASYASDEMLLAFGPAMLGTLHAVPSALNAIARSFDDIGDAADKLKLGDWSGALFGRTESGELSGAAEMLRKGLATPSDVPAIPTPFAEGGIVNKRTFAMLGERGREAVVPLDGSNSPFGGDAIKDNSRETSENTKELKKLNDEIFEMLHPAGGGGGFNLGSGPGGGVPGGVPSGADLGGGGAPGAPYGSSVGPGSGEGAGETPSHGGGGGGAPSRRGSRARGGGGAGGGGPSFNDRFGNWQKTAGGAGMTAAGGNAAIAASRAGFAKQLEDPNVRMQVAGMLMTEGTPEPTAESLFNRSAMTGKSLMQMLHSGFYGPINRGQLSGAMARLRRDPKAMARMNAAIDAALAGADTIHGATDQGMPSDPNGMWPGGRMVIRGEGGTQVFNDWGGGGGHAASARWRENFERMAQQPAQGYDPTVAGAMQRWGIANMSDSYRRTIDAASARAKIEATGKLTANINAPPGTSVGVEGGGVFKNIEINRQTQMRKARQGPSASDFSTP